MVGKTPDIRPPKPPWVRFNPRESAGGALSFYYSDPNSSIPVREVTRADDNKADPNLETKTYGLFTTCERGMRAGIVKRGIEYVFFCTRRGSLRRLTGYYRIGWFCRGPAIQGYARVGRVPDDYALAASEIHFVNPGFPLQDLTRILRGVWVETRFRTFRYFDSETTRRLRELIQRTPNATREYLAEVKRLENANLQKYGYMYRNWRRREGFSWKVAPLYLEVTK